MDKMVNYMLFIFYHYEKNYQKNCYRSIKEQAIGLGEILVKELKASE